MSEHYLFCDGSFHPQLKIGVGAVLHLPGPEWEKTKNGQVFAIRTKLIPADSIARIELLTALWALAEPGLPKGVKLFTDCQTIEDLPGRRSKLEAKDFKSGRTGLPLSNADLYHEFFKVYDALKPQITWIKGHSPSARQSNYERIFSLVDKEARRVLREEVESKH